MGKKLLDQLREALRLKHYSYRTEEAYVEWVKRWLDRSHQVINTKWGDYPLSD